MIAHEASRQLKRDVAIQLTSPGAIVDPEHWGVFGVIRGTPKMFARHRAKIVRDLDAQKPTLDRLITSGFVELENGHSHADYRPTAKTELLFTQLLHRNTRQLGAGPALASLLD